MAEALTPEQVLEAVGDWSLLQVSEFVKKFEEKFDVSATAAVRTKMCLLKHRRLGNLLPIDMQPAVLDRDALVRQRRYETQEQVGRVGRAAWRFVQHDIATLRSTAMP